MTIRKRLVRLSSLVSLHVGVLDVCSTVWDVDTHTVACSLMDCLTMHTPDVILAQGTA